MSAIFALVGGGGDFGGMCGCVFGWVHKVCTGGRGGEIGGYMCVACLCLTGGCGCFFKASAMRKADLDRAMILYVARKRLCVCFFAGGYFFCSELSLLAGFLECTCGLGDSSAIVALRGSGFFDCYERKTCFGFALGEARGGGVN